MRHLLFVPILFILFACNNAETASKDSPAREESKTIVLSAANRKVLVIELKKLKDALSSKDKNQLAEFFQFPIVTEEGDRYIDDSILEENKGKITEQVFLQNFDEIYGNLSFEPLFYCINQIKIDSLQLKDEIVDDLPVDNHKPCYSTYQATLSHDTLVVQTSSNSNSDYVPKKGEEDDSSDACESLFVWQFWFNGQKLVFIKHYAAG